MFKVGVAGSYECGTCGGVLKYQGQADALLRRYATEGAGSVAELVHESAFRALNVYEPGGVGPFRQFFANLPGYVQSVYRPESEGGDGVRCEDLMALSFANDEFDLVITTDVFEHVRHPYVAFAEIFRVLRRGGNHVFTVPGVYPLPEQTRQRVHVNGEADVFILEPVYHGTHLVYNDFGEDLTRRLTDIGFETKIERFELPGDPASKQLTFCSHKR